MNPENITPYRYRKGATKARENGIKGGIASGVSKREKKTLRELAEALRDTPPPKWAAKLGDTYGGAAIAAIFEKAMRGDVAAFRALMELLGETREGVTINTPPASPFILGLMPEAETRAAWDEHERRRLEKS